MGVFTDWLANQIVLGEHPYTGERRLAYNEIRWHVRRTDLDHHSAYLAEDELQLVTQGAPGPSRYTLTFTMPDGTQITTGEILASWAGPQLEAVINTACAPVIPGWTDGDIAWLGGSVNNPPLALEYSGDSVKAQNWGDLQAQLTWPFFSPLTTATHRNGHGIRYTWSVLYELGLYGPPPPAPGADLPEDAELLYRPDETARWPSASLRSMLAQQASIDEGNAELDSQLRSLFNIQ